MVDKFLDLIMAVVWFHVECGIQLVLSYLTKMAVNGDLIKQWCTRSDKHNVS